MSDLSVTKTLALELNRGWATVWFDKSEKHLALTDKLRPDFERVGASLTKQPMSKTINGGASR